MLASDLLNLSAQSDTLGYKIPIIGATTVTVNDLAIFFSVYANAPTSAIGSPF
jgi:hypothetical protein